MRAGSDLPPIRVRYAIAANMPDERLIARVHEVVELWNRQRETEIPTIADAVERLLNEHVEFSLDGDVESPVRWRELLRSPARPRIPQTPPEDTGPAPAEARLPRPDDVEPAGEVPAASEPQAEPENTDYPAPGEVGEEVLEDQPPVPVPEVAGAQASMAPPTDIDLQITDDGVALRWSTPADSTGDVRYVVTRPGLMSGRVINETTWFDGEPPAGQKFRYRITAVSGDGIRRSHAVTAQVLYAPKVTNYRWWMTRTGEVHAELRPPTHALAVEVRRTSGEPSANPAVGVHMDVRDNVFVDPAPPPGRLFYNFVPIYPGPYRGESTGFPVDVLPLPEPPSLDSVEVGPDGSLVVRCAVLPEDVSLLLMRVSREPAGSVGDVLLPDELARFGTGVELVHANECGCITAPQPIGAAVYVPFAVAGRRAVRGPSRRVPIIPPVTGLEATRRGQVAMVSWGWPIGVKLAVVGVKVGDAEPVLRQITRMEFKLRGGFEFKHPYEAQITVAGAVIRGGELLQGEPIAIVAAAQPPVVYFTVSRPWWDWFGLGRSRQVTICATESCDDVRVQVYLRSPGSDRDIDLHVLHAPQIGPDKPVRETIQLRDDGVRRPYFIKIRATRGTAELDVDWTRCIGREVK
jgi:hypothetical protein